MIIQTVPLNSGDAALLEAMVYGLQKVISISKIVVACDNLEEVRLKYPQYHLVENFDKSKVTLNKPPGLYLRKILRWLHLESVIVNIIPFAWYRQYNKAIKECDLIFLAPGGYFNNLYNNDDRLTIIGKMKKPIFIIGQSIGPFENGSQVEKRAIGLFRKMPFIGVREIISYKWLKAQDCQNVISTQDIAFLLYIKYNIDLSKRQYPENVKSVVMNFRSWKNDTENILQKAIVICKHLLNLNIHITFLSTCQGHASYVDDSILAQSIVSRGVFESGIHIDRNPYNPIQLVEQFAKYDLYIGMRLHGAILSMVSGTPAINIGYEYKSEGIYQTLKCPLTIHYENDAEDWVRLIDHTLTHYNEHYTALPSMMLQASQLAMQTFDHFKLSIDHDQ